MPSDNDNPSSHDNDLYAYYDDHGSPNDDNQREGPAVNNTTVNLYNLDFPAINNNIREIYNELSRIDDQLSSVRNKLFDLRKYLATFAAPDNG